VQRDAHGGGIATEHVKPVADAGAGVEQLRGVLDTLVDGPPVDACGHGGRSRRGRDEVPLRGDGEAERAAEPCGACARRQRVGAELVDLGGEPAVVRGPDRQPRQPEGASRAERREEEDRRRVEGFFMACCGGGASLCGSSARLGCGWRQVVFGLEKEMSMCGSL